ncbi:hypothetical protein M434DRAFT_38242 [Hypoxylon sp. CO27-5]|nr:hypothetical protein M434DRAFT_38242 [Hypoxylon sp. CO27-5]
MDHIRRPVNSVIPHLEVPFLDIIPYQLGHFDDFWRIAGFEQTTSGSPINEATPGSLDHNQDSDFISGYGNPPSSLARDRSTIDYARLIQSWLYFGLLSEYTGKVVNPLDFLHITTDNRRLVTSRNPLETLLKPAKHNARLLEKSKSFLDQISRIPYATQAPFPSILLSVNVLLSLLGRINPLYNNSLCLLEPGLPQTRLLAERMSSIGWCPRHINRICGTLGADKAYFVSLLNRHERSGIDHSLCSETSCRANDTNKKTYKTLHVSQDCPCPMVGVDEVQLAEIIRQSKIPIVHVETDPITNIPTLKLTAASALSRYIAVSHVWADGLGNPWSNSLPQCQIERLARQISALPKGNKIGNLFYEPYSFGHFSGDWVPATSENSQQKSRCFWIDTLCVPVSEQLKGLRIQAINKMAAIYVGASHVLVLDYELQQLRLGTQPLHDHKAYIVSCNWNSRSWTYQEGKLGRSCYFQCADGALKPSVSRGGGLPLNLEEWGEGTFSFIMSMLISISRPYIRLLWPITNTLKYVLLCAWYIFDVSKDTPAIQWRLRYRLRNCLRLFAVRILLQNTLTWILYVVPYVNTHSQNLAGAWNELAHRSTTKADDLYLILCNLIGRKTYQLKGLKSNSERMAAIISSCETIPQAFLYNRGTRCLENEDHLDRWLPTVVNGGYLSRSPPLVIKENSLYANPAGLKPIMLLPPTKLDGTYSLFTKEDAFICNIEAHRPKDDRFQVDRNRYVATGILLEKDIRAYYGHIRGACVHVASIKDSSSNDPIFLSVVYDCPVTAVQSFTPKTGIGDNNSPKIYIDRFVQKCNLQIKREPLLFQHRLSQRRNDANSHPTVSIIALVLWTATGMGALTSLDNSVPSFFIVFGALGIGLSFISPMYLEPMHLYIIIIYPTMQNRARFFAFVISRWVAIIIFVIYEFIWIPHEYNAWVASFAEEPVPWYKSFNIGSRRWRAIFRQRRRDLPSQPNDIEMQSTNNQV